MTKTVTRADLGNSVYREVGLSMADSAQLVDALLEEVSDALVRGDTVKIPSFGSFSSRKKKARIGRNPKTGVEVEIPPRTVLTFNPSNSFRDDVNRNLGGHVRKGKK